MDQPPVFRGDRIAPLMSELHCGYCDDQLRDWHPAHVYPTGGFMRSAHDGVALLCDSCWELFCMHEAWIEEQGNAAP